MTHLLHRSIHTPPRRAVSASGISFTDDKGQTYIDASGGAAVSCLGHAHPEVIAALHAQLDKLAYAHTGFFTTDVAEELAAHLIADAPEGLSHVYLLSGGSEAVEAALKMARQYFTETGPAAAPSYHRTATKLSRQHIGRAGCRGQRMAPCAIQTPADGGASHRAVFCVSRTARG